LRVRVSVSVRVRVRGRGKPRATLCIVRVRSVVLISTPPNGPSSLELSPRLEARDAWEM